MSKGFDMLRDYIEHDALCMRRRKCCDFEYELQQEFAALEAENAKLRKLLLDVWNDATQFDDFWDYVHDDGEIYNEDELPHYQERMRELGIKVN